LQRIVSHIPPGKASLDNVSIVIPTLNAARTLGACLDCLSEAGGAEILVVDGGSCDDTVTRALARGATVTYAARGRGIQLRAGADRASRSWLLFLHADTHLQAGWSQTVDAWARRASAPDGYGVFDFKLDDSGWRARLLECLVHVRVRLLGLPYGDQGLLVHRNLYAKIGGFADIPLMEDVDLVRRLGKSRLTVFKASATTSAERWRRDGWVRRSLRNLTCLALFHLGVPPDRIARIYER
jgi:rSAM/selenodomain-associated transferase 2